MSELRRGLIYAACAYGLWGLFPLYWKLLRPTGAVEILAHRLVWSAIFVAIVIAGMRQFGAMKALFKRPRTLLGIGLAGIIIAVNWGTYIYGVNTDRVVETALGYFMNPLVTVLLGVAVLGERLRHLQWAAVGIGAIALAVLTIDYGRLPWIALVLGVSFAVYGLIKKKIHLPASQGLFAETAVIALPAMGFLVWLQFTGTGSFAAVSLPHTLLLAGAGITTAVPLLFFAGAANRLPLTAIGMGQYIAPSIQFAIGVFVFHEAMPAARWLGFGLVWIALAFFTFDAIRNARRRIPTVPATPAVASAGT